MTEIPEHLLKRSKARKGGAADDSGPVASGAVEAAGSGAAPPSAGPASLVAAAAAIPADKPAAARPPDPAYIVAAKARKKMPLWAMGLVACVPLWALSYAGTMQQPEVEDLLYIDAAEVYVATGGCAGCHGAAGGGAQGYAFTAGEIIASFPDPVDQMVHVARGSAAIAGEPYGSPDRPGGQRIAGAKGSGAMPGQATGLTQLVLELAIFHERIVLGGDDPLSPENVAWIESLRERIEAGEETAVDLELLLSCADPTMTPGANPDTNPDRADCPGGEAPEGEESAAGE